MAVGGVCPAGRRAGGWRAALHVTAHPREQLPLHALCRYMPLCSYKSRLLSLVVVQCFLLWLKLMSRYWDRLRQACCTDADPGDIIARRLW